MVNRTSNNSELPKSRINNKGWRPLDVSADTLYKTKVTEKIIGCSGFPGGHWWGDPSITINTLQKAMGETAQEIPFTSDIMRRRSIKRVPDEIRKLEKKLWEFEWGTPEFKDCGRRASR